MMMIEKNWIEVKAPSLQNAKLPADVLEAGQRAQSSAFYATTSRNSADTTVPVETHKTISNFDEKYLATKIADVVNAYHKLFVKECRRTSCRR